MVNVGANQSAIVHKRCSALLGVSDATDACCSTVSSSDAAVSSSDRTFASRISISSTRRTLRHQTRQRLTRHCPSHSAAWRPPRRPGSYQKHADATQPSRPSSRLSMDRAVVVSVDGAVAGICEAAAPAQALWTHSTSWSMCCNNGGVRAVEDGPASAHWSTLGACPRRLISRLLTTRMHQRIVPRWPRNCCAVSVGTHGSTR